MPDADEKISRADGVVWKQIGEQAVVIDTEGGGVFELIGPATRIWELLADEPSMAELVDTLDEEFEIDRQTLRSEAERTIDELIAAGLARR